MKTLLNQILKSPELHGRFLNTFSFLEYVGARKIIKSQPQSQFSADLLAHAVEEMRHALVIKRAAQKYLPDICDTYSPESLLCGDAAFEYIQTVDHAAKNEFSITDPWLCYLYTTYLVEERANWLYPLYEEVIKEHNLPSVFRGILVEEEKHLQEILFSLKGVAESQTQLNILKNREREAFDAFISSIENEVINNIKITRFKNEEKEKSISES